MQIMNQNYNNYNPSVMNNHYLRNHNAPVVNGMWRQPMPIGESDWRWMNGVVKKPKSLKRTRNYGDGIGKSRKKLQFRNRKKLNGGGKSTTSFVRRAKKARGVETLRCPPAPCLFGNRSGDVPWGENVERQWGIDLHGSMKGLIRLRSPASVIDSVANGDGGCNCTDEDEDPVQFERRLSRYLSKYEIILPKSGSSIGANNKILKTGGDQGKFRQTSPLVTESMMLKQRLAVMDWNMDDLKQRVELLERRFKVNIIKGVKEKRSGDDGESFMHSVDLCMDEVESDADHGGTFGEVIPHISEAIVELNEFDDKQVKMEHNDKSIGENGLSDSPALFTCRGHPQRSNVVRQKNLPNQKILNGKCPAKRNLCIRCKWSRLTSYHTQFEVYMLYALEVTCTN
ncbi:hypothetical protein QQ045_015994 [Rhodiola kirilowii]